MGCRAAIAHSNSDGCSMMLATRWTKWRRATEPGSSRYCQPGGARLQSGRHIVQYGRLAHGILQSDRGVRAPSYRMSPAPVHLPGVHQDAEQYFRTCVSCGKETSHFPVLRSWFPVLSPWFSVPGSQFSVPGSQSLVLSSRFPVLSPWFSVLGSRFSVPGSQFSVLSSWFLVLSSRFSVLSPGGASVLAHRSSTPPIQSADP
jgi:hypothetical protein